MSKPMLLLILDGWGYNENPEYNAIHAANTPTWDYLWQHNPHTFINCSGKSVGLPDGQMGNSEVGHLNMGAGRIVYQDLTRIDKSIESGEFNNNPVLLAAIAKAKQHDSALHILGLLSAGGVHSHEKHIHAMIKLADSKGVNKIYIHAFLDGRDTPPKSALASIKALQSLCDQLGTAKIISLCGRYYAMDRDKRWERIQQAYDLLTLAKTDYQYESAEQGLAAAYQRGETDEFVKPTSIHPINQEAITIKDGDSVVFMNFRADRARQLTQALTEHHIEGMAGNPPPALSGFVSLTQYSDKFKVDAAFPPGQLHNILAEYLAEKGLTQLHIAETEKYAHVTFFFNGGREAAFPNEERILIASPKVATYDLQPEMSAAEVTKQIVNAIDQQQYDVIIANYANPDMVGHTGNFSATVKAIETIDQCLGEIFNALKKANGSMLITADHGNAESMFNPETDQPHTAHTSHPVPLLYVSSKPAKFLMESGLLSDIAPTMLYLMNLTQPPEMTGHNLIEYTE